MTIRLQGFQGEFPQISPRLLPDSAAQIAQNVRLEDGALIPYRSLLGVHTFGGNMGSFHLDGASWIGWAATGVKAAPGPIADDRLYVFGDGAPKMIYSGSAYALALPAPASAPDAALQPSTDKMLIGSGGSSSRFEFDGTNWTVESTAVTANFTAQQVIAPVGESTAVLTDDVSDRTLVAQLPRTPATGAVVALVQQGEGRVILHRNGQSIDGAEIDTSLTTDQAAIAALFFGGTWIVRSISDAFQTLTASSTIGSGQHASVNSTSAVTLTLPASPSAGDIASAIRLGTGTVTFNGNGANVNGAATFAIPVQNDRYVVMFNGTEWKALKIVGAYDAAYLSASAHTVLADVKAYRFQVGSASRAGCIELPADATNGEVVKIGRIGSRSVLVLPNGADIDATPAPLSIATDGAFLSFTKGASGWTSATITDHAATTGAMDAASDTIIFALAKRRDYTVKLPAGPTVGDFVEIHISGGYQVSVSPNGGAIAREPDEDIAEDVLFAYTWVTSLDEESPPSPLSDALLWSPDIPVLLSGFSAPPASRLVDRVRIYRSQTSATGTTDLYFVAELALPVASWTFNDGDNPIAEIIPSSDYDPPPAGLTGVVTLPNGMMAAFVGRKLMFCEPYLPHAWPTKYQLTVDYPIVGLAAFGSILAVMTTGTPYVVQGTQPDTMAVEKVESALPCLAAEGIVDLGYAAAYPSAEGLVLVQPSGASIVTRKLFTRQQWAAMNPASFRAGSSAGRYVFSWDDAGTRKCGIIDLTGEAPFFVRTDQTVQRFHVDHRTGKLYTLHGGVNVSEWDAGASPLTMRWKSKPFRVAQAVSYGAMRLEPETRALAGGETVSIKVYAGGALLHTETAYGIATRLPSALSDTWEVEITGTLPVSLLTIAESMPKLVMP